MEPILYIGITQSIFAGILIASKRPQNMSDKILAAWLFLIGIAMLITLINISIYELTAFVVFPFIYGPLLYLYTKSLIEEKFIFKLVYYLHFIPFFILLGLSIGFREKPVMNLNEFFVDDTYISLRMIYSISFFISILTYSILTFVKIDKHQKEVRNLFSYISQKVTLNWLKIVSISFFVGYLVMFIAGGIKILIYSPTPDPTIFSFIGLTFFAFAFSFYGIKQHRIYAVLNQNSDPVTKNAEEKNMQEIKYQKSGLKSSEGEKQLKLLLQLMQDEKLYLNPKLCIQDIAEKLLIPRHHLTQIINEQLKKNFYTFINEYRIAEAKERLLSVQYRHYTLLAIAYDSGFNSKSSFNTLFKNATGFTPTAFRLKFSEKSS